MISIFNSPKQLVLHTAADRQAVLRSLNARITPQPAPFDLFAWCSIRWGTFLGQTDGSDINVRYISYIRNSLQPTMHIHVETATSGGTVVLTRFSANLFVKIFLIFWMTGATAPIVLTLAHGHLPVGPLGMFPFFGIFLICLMRAFATVDERQLEQLVRGAVAQAEGRGALTKQP